MNPMNEEQSVDYSKCWGNPLGDCAGGMTGEHAISRNQLGAGTITVQGYPWCRDKPKTVGISSLVAKILSKRHNNDASCLDDAAADTLRAFETVAERSARVAQGRTGHPRRILRVSGDRLERWLLKTTINLALQAKPAPVGGIFAQTGRPARRYIDIVYGHGEFEPAEGLTWVAQVGEQIRNADRNSIRFESWLRKEDKALVAAFMTFHGHRLWLAGEGAPAIENGLHPVRAIDVTNINLRIEFEWSSRNRQLPRLGLPR
jgi:hypothetical protein